jgi:hypothetical protein
LKKMKFNPKTTVMILLMLALVVTIVISVYPVGMRVMIEAPPVEVGEDGSITLGHHKTGFGGNEYAAGAIWVDGQYLCCGPLSMTCQVDKPAEGLHTITGYVVLYDDSTFATGVTGLCSGYDAGMNNVYNLVTDTGVNSMRQGYSGFRENTIEWYVYQEQPGVTTTPPGTTTVELPPPEDVKPNYLGYILVALFIVLFLIMFFGDKVFK